MPYVTPSCAQFTSEQLQLATGTPVGAGAMSTVVQSTLRTSGLAVAVKVLSKIQLLQQQKVEAAMNEKTALVTLGPHPYIARLYGTAQTEDELYFVLEWLPNGDLLQHIRRTVVERVAAYNHTLTSSVPASSDAKSSSTAGASDVSEAQTTEHAAKTHAPIPPSSTLPRCLPFRDVQLITAQLVLGLARVFEKGFVVRDLKPENVAFDDHYRAVMLDFDTVDLQGEASGPVSNQGVALRPEAEDAANGVPIASDITATRAAASAEDSAAARAPKRRLTVSEIQSMRKKTASFCGTAQYVSPEMVGECRWSFASDLWSLGTVVYEMVYGTHMFSGVNAYAVLKKVLQGVGPSEATASLVSFQPLNFAEEEAPAASPATAQAPPKDGEAAFADVKDFILALVAIDPLTRLGVHPVTHTFDLDAIKQHALFKDFDWATVEAPLRTFEMYDFTDPARSPPARAAGEKASDTTVAACRSADPSPSLETCYTRRPHHDESYAAYVYKATADANPFERFLQGVLDPSSATTAPATPSATEEAVVVKATATTAPAEATGETTVVEASTSQATADGGDDSDSDSLEIVDDVGMHYEGRPAPEEFRN